MRKALHGSSRYIATPNVTKHRLFVWLDAQVLPDHQLIVVARDDEYMFGVLHSRVREVWARGLGTQVREYESGFRYISDEELLLRTLTNLYNERPAWLRDVHARLDAAVLDAYGWPADISDDDLLGRLLALNLERAGFAAATVTSVADG
jgi:hypothetical protein